LHARDIKKRSQRENHANLGANHGTNDGNHRDNPGLYNSWKDSVYAQLYRDLFKAPNDEKDYLFKAKQPLAHYQLMDQTSLLEFAVWKAVCILHPPTPHMRYYSWKSWETSGWKESKTAWNARFLLFLTDMQCPIEAVDAVDDTMQSYKEPVFSYST
jgi:hypothetical protein